MRILFCGGGTGGHVNPAISIANTILQKHPDTQIAFVGTRHGIESSLVPKAGYPIHFVKVRGFKRKISLSNIDAAVKAVTSVWAAKKSSKNFSPTSSSGRADTSAGLPLRRPPKWASPA